MFLQLPLKERLSSFKEGLPIEEIGLTQHLSEPFNYVYARTQRTSSIQIEGPVTKTIDLHKYLYTNTHGGLITIPFSRSIGAR